MSDPREAQAAHVLREAINTKQAAALMDALISGGGFMLGAQLTVVPKTILSDRRRDAITITLTNHTAGTLVQLDELGMPTDAARELNDELRTKVQGLLDGMGSLLALGAMGYEITGIESDEIDETVEHGTVAYVYRDHWAAAQSEWRKLQTLSGLKPPLPELNEVSQAPDPAPDGS